MTSPQTFSQIDARHGKHHAGPSSRAATRSPPRTTARTSSRRSPPAPAANRFTVINFADPAGPLRADHADDDDDSTRPGRSRSSTSTGSRPGPRRRPRVGWVATGSANTGQRAGERHRRQHHHALDHATRAGNGQFFQVDMGTFRTFTQVTLDAGTTTNDFPRSWQLQTSNNGTHVHDGDQRNGTTALVTINVPRADRALHQDQPDGGQCEPWSIQELNVSGPALTRTGLGRDGVVEQHRKRAGQRRSTAAPRPAGARSGRRPAQTFTVDIGAVADLQPAHARCGDDAEQFPRNYSVFVSNDGDDFGNRGRDRDGLRPAGDDQLPDPDGALLPHPDPTTPANSNTWSDPGAQRRRGSRSRAIR